jgi:hypothetical protein
MDEVANLLVEINENLSKILSVLEREERARMDTAQINYIDRLENLGVLDHESAHRLKLDVITAKRSRTPDEDSPSSDEQSPDHTEET